MFHFSCHTMSLIKLIEYYTDVQTMFQCSCHTMSKGKIIKNYHRRSDNVSIFLPYNVNRDLFEDFVGSPLSYLLLDGVLACPYCQTN